MKKTSIFELALEAIKVINHPVSSNMFLKMPGEWGQSDIRHLSGPNSPEGTVVQEFEDYIVVCFDPIDILAWCVANGQVGVGVLRPDDKR